MLYQELPPIESTRLDGWGRWIVPAVIAAAALTTALLLFVLGQAWFAAAAIFAGLATSVFVALRELPVARIPTEQLIAGPDYTLVGAALALSREPSALTSI